MSRGEARDDREEGLRGFLNSFLGRVRNTDADNTFPEGALVAMSVLFRQEEFLWLILALGFSA